METRRLPRSGFMSVARSFAYTVVITSKRVSTPAKLTVIVCPDKSVS